MNKLGKRLVAGAPSEEDQALYGEVIVFFSEVMAYVQARLERHRWSKVIGRPIDIAVTGRAKTKGTLMDKLRRTPEVGMGYVRDIAGVRMVGVITLREQDLVVTEVAGMFGQAKVFDLREDPHMGYRAVHVVIDVNGALVEVQVRTALQAGWADLYERAGDHFGRGIRYGEIPDEPHVQVVVETMLKASREMADFERQMDALLAEAQQMERDNPKPRAIGRMPKSRRREAFARRAATKEFADSMQDVLAMTAAVAENLGRIDPSDIPHTDVL